MKVDERRIQTLNNHTYQSGSVLYWMNRDARVDDNWALIYAQELALQYDVPLLVTYNLEPGFLGGGYRQHAFKVKGLMEIEQQLFQKNIPFFLLSGKKTEKDLETCIAQYDIGYVVTDFSPLRHVRAWISYLQKKLVVPFCEVDTHNIVPVWITSDKQEYSARTIRPKLHTLLPEFLTDFPKIKKHLTTPSFSMPKIDWKNILDDSRVDQNITEVDWVIPGSKGAKKALKNFLKNNLKGYANQRNDANKKGQSNLSPYFHFGQLSPQRVAWEVMRSVGLPLQKIVQVNQNGSATGNDAVAFLEELIIRRELADNFCWHNKNYDNTKGFPDWAQKTLLQHANDEREYLYTIKEFEQGKTHDDLWNAAQMEMVRTGKMHGYMRMYWAKKILQWTKHADEAMKIAIYLNDTYELDGRDPNGYTGIAWSIGGVHDRPWFRRPIFGTVRYMAQSGCAKKFDIVTYISKHLSK